LCDNPAAMSRILWLVVETLGSLLAVACVLRAYGHRVHLNPRNPISQFVSALTDWLVMPLRKLIAPSRTMDWASVLAAMLVAALTAVLFFVVVGGVQVPNPGSVLFLAAMWLVRWTVYLMIGLVIIQAILSWVNPYAPLAPAIQQLTQPFLAPIRKFVPLIGGVDLSPLVLIIVLQVLLMIVDPAILPGLLR
jgi:YggT family protein